MVNKLLNARLGAVLPTDPSVALWTWLKSIWGTTTGYTVPASTSIKFDTKFGEFKGFYNYIVIENMPSTVKPQILGGTRFVNEEVKRMQILCIGTSAKNTKWNMERHIDSLINGNITGLQTTYGIDTVLLDSFQEIPVIENDDVKSNLSPNKGFQRARSTANITLRYQQYQA